MKDILKSRRVHISTRFIIPTEVSAIGFRQEGKIFITVAINWDAEEETELDERISTLMTDSLESGDDLDEISAYCRIYPNTISYNPELIVD